MKTCYRFIFQHNVYISIFFKKAYVYMHTRKPIDSLSSFLFCCFFLFLFFLLLLCHTWSPSTHTITPIPKNMPFQSVSHALSLLTCRINRKQEEHILCTGACCRGNDSTVHQRDDVRVVEKPIMLNLLHCSPFLW